MNILFLTENFPPEVNAAASRVYERACYWVKWGHEVTVITGAPNFPQGKVYKGYKNRWYQVEDISGIRVVRVKTFIAKNQGMILRTLDFLSYMLMAVVAGLFQKRPDVIVSTSPQFFTALGGWILSVLRWRPYVFELGDLWPASIAAVGAIKQGFLLRQIERIELFLYRRSAVVIALTEPFKNDLIRRGISRDKITVILNGVDLPRYGKREKDLELEEVYRLTNKFVIGYIGTHGVAHALEDILQVAGAMNGTPDIVFLFVGDGAAKQDLVKIAEEKGLKNVKFVPAQPKEEIARYWSVCDAALVSLKDNNVFKTVIPSKIFEAMGMGLPIMYVGPEGEASRIIEEERVGISVLPKVYEVIKDRIIQLKEDDDLRVELGFNSCYAATKYSRERQAEKMIKVLHRLSGCSVHARKGASE